MANSRRANSIGNLNEWLTTPQAADKLGLTPASVGAYCHSGRLAACKIGQTWLIHRDEIAKYNQARKPVGRPKNNL